MRSSTYSGVVFLCALSGCHIYGKSQKKGMEGTLGFYEPNSYPADTTTTGIGFERAIALGARADVWVTAPGVNTLSSATSDNPEVVSVSLQVYPIVLRGVAEGTTTLRVSTSTASDSLALSVVRADGARVWAPTKDSLSFGVPDSFFGSGPAYREGADVTVAAEPLWGTRPLLGFDIFEWAIDPPLLSMSDGSGVNAIQVTALGQAGVATVSTQLGGSFEVTTLAAGDVPILKIYRTPPDLSQPTPITALAPEDIATFALGATDAAGHYVVPGPRDQATFHADVTSGTVKILEAKLSGHYVTLKACTGAGIVRLSYLGAELSVPIEVSAQVADPACT